MTDVDAQLINFTKSDIFTPDDPTMIMTSEIKKQGSLLEPSVGTGNLLKYIDVEMYDRVDVFDIKQEYIDKIQDDRINKRVSDFVKLDELEAYDNIIMNPPYIKVQDLSVEYRNYIKSNFPLLKRGTIDLYYVFLIKCLSLLKDDGVMVAITPNSYLYTKTAKPLRKFLIENRYIEKIYDFGYEKVFPGTSVYCCITVFTKKAKTHLSYQSRKNSGLPFDNKEIDYTEISEEDYSIFDEKQSGVCLKDVCKIKNGIATLRDKIFIHNTQLFDEPCWKRITNGREDKFIIYPYNDGVICDEDSFKSNNPKTYEYLCENKEELAKRDKGNKKYPQWYAFGRTQSNKLCKTPKMLIIPTFVDPDNLKMKETEPVFYYSALGIEPNANVNVEDIMNSIKSSVSILKNGCTKKGGGWISLSSRDLYKLPLRRK